MGKQFDQCGRDKPKITVRYTIPSKNRMSGGKVLSIN